MIKVVGYEWCIPCNIVHDLNQNLPYQTQSNLLCLDILGYFREAAIQGAPPSCV